MGESLEVRITDTIKYLKRHKEHALLDLDGERKAENWLRVIHTAHWLRLIEQRILDLEHLLK